MLQISYIFALSLFLPFSRSPRTLKLIYFQFISNHFFPPVRCVLGVHSTCVEPQQWKQIPPLRLDVSIPFTTLHHWIINRNAWQCQSIIFWFSCQSKIQQFRYENISRGAKKLNASWSQPLLFMCSFLCVNQCSQQKLNESTLNPTSKSTCEHIVEQCRHFIDSGKSFSTATKAKPFTQCVWCHIHIYLHIVVKRFFARFGKYEPYAMRECVNLFLSVKN